VVANRRYGYFPTLDGMTGFAIRTELPAMNVRMAIRTFLAHVRKNELHVALSALHFFVHAAQWIARFLVVKFRNAADGLPAQGSVAVLAGNIESAVRITCNWFLRSTTRPLGMCLEREQKNAERQKCSTEHGHHVPRRAPIPSIEVRQGWMQRSGQDCLYQLYSWTVLGQRHACTALFIDYWTVISNELYLETNVAITSLGLSVAGLALSRRRFVEHNALSLDFTSQFVTIGAGYVAVSALERKWSALVVIEFRRLPPRRIVATRAVGSVFACGELSPMRVAVAAGALLRSRAEIDIL
jgi:hypothetical protein